MRFRSDGEAGDGASAGRKTMMALHGDVIARVAAGMCESVFSDPQGNPVDYEAASDGMREYMHDVAESVLALCPHELTRDEGVERMVGMAQQRQDEKGEDRFRHDLARQSAHASIWWVLRVFGLMLSEADYKLAVMEPANEVAA